MNPMPTSPGASPVGKTCDYCGAVLPVGKLGGLCAACLLQQGALTEGPEGRTQTRAFEPLPLSEIARLFPRYEILACIGRGGMGAVYKARQPALDRFVAIKVLGNHASDSGFSERFGREARALAKLVHPNIVAVHESGQVEGWSYIVMEFVDGVNLRQLGRAGRLSPRAALQIVPQICDALQFAHDHGIVHRDIKPENVLMDTRGRVKIADFGIAKLMQLEGSHASYVTGPGEVMGTPHYMAPEQVEQPQSVDHRADIYSLGVVFYELLTGELPIGKFQPPSRKVEVDVRLDEVVLRALEKSPGLRYQTATDFRQQVETVSTSPPTPAPDDDTDGDYVAKASLNEQLWRLVPLGAVVLSFFNPWGSKAWIWFAGFCAVLAVFPPVTYTESWEAPQRRQVYRMMGFRTRWGRWFAGLGWLGFIGLLGFKEGWEALRGFFIFFGFFGIAVLVEIYFRKTAPAEDREARSPTQQRNLARRILYRSLVTLVIAVVVALFVRTFLLEPFAAASDAAAPEVPKGSHVLVWKVGGPPAPGDLIAYRFKGVPCVGRVTQVQGDLVFVDRPGDKDEPISSGAIVGRVVSVYWRPPASAPPPKPSSPAPVPAPAPASPQGKASPSDQ